MALRSNSIFSACVDVPVYTRIRSGVPATNDNSNTSSGSHKRSKAHSKMGVGQGPSRDSVMKAFARNTPDAFSFTDYLLWWDSLREPKEASEFVGDLIYFCVALHDSKQKKIRKSWFEKGGKLTRPQNFALARRAGKTIHYIACCYKIGQSTHLAQAIGDWHEAQKQLNDLREKNNSNDISTVIDSPVVLHSILLLERIVGRQTGMRPSLSAAASYWSQVIAPRVIECTFVGPEDSIVGQASDGLLSLEGGGGNGGGGGGGGAESELDPDVAYCFSSCGDYPHVLALLHESMWWSFPGDGEKVDGECGAEEVDRDGSHRLSDNKGTSGAFIVYENLGKLLKRLPSRARLNPTVARNTLLASVHLFRRMLERHPILDFDFIVSLHETLVPYLRWAAPYCTAVTGLLKCLEAEAISPGASLRQWHGRCRPLLGKEGVALSKKRKTQTKSVKDDKVSERVWHRLGSTVVVYYDAGSPLACMQVHLALCSDGVEENTADDNNGSTIHHDVNVLRRSLITQVIDAEYELIPQRVPPAIGVRPTDVLGPGVDDAYIDTSTSSTPPITNSPFDPLRLASATTAQLSIWWDVCQRVTAHLFGKDVGEGLEWSADNAYAVKRCRRAALAKLVRTIDESLSTTDGGEVRTLVTRDCNVEAAQRRDERTESLTSSVSSASSASSNSSILVTGVDHSRGSTGTPLHGRSSFGHAVPPPDPRLTMSARGMARHDPEAKGGQVSPPPTLTTIENFLGFDDESTLLMSTIDAFCQGSADAIEATDGSRSSVIASIMSKRRRHEGLAHTSRAANHVVTMGEEGEDEDFGSDQSVLRLCTVGNGECVHQFVMAYVRVVSELRDRWSTAEEADATKRDEKEKEKGGSADTSDLTRWSILRALLDTCVRIYIIPVGRDGNDLACWMAHRDGWYRRTIFSTFQSQLELVPALRMPPGKPSLESMATDFLRVDAHTKKIVHDDSQPPMCSTIPASLMDYTSNARRTLPVTLFRCECWTLPSTTIPGSYGESCSRYSLPSTEMLDRHRSSSTSSNVSTASKTNTNAQGRPASNRIRGSAAPLVIPFATRIEIGMSTLLREYADEIGVGSFNSSESSSGGNETKDDDLSNASRDAWRDEAICSKGFHTWYNSRVSSLSGGSSGSSSSSNGTSGIGVTPLLMIKFTENDMNGEVLPLSQEQALVTNQYVHLSISNCFKYTRPAPASDITSIDCLSPCSPGTDPLSSSVGLRCVSSTQQLMDMLKKKKWSTSDLAAYRETICTSSLQHHAGIVEISSIDPKNGFSILLDGALYGPFQKIRCVVLPFPLHYIHVVLNVRSLN